MKTVTVRDLRNNFAKVETWLGEGETIQIEKRGVPIAILTAPGKSEPAFRKPDFLARIRENWGGRVFSDEEVRRMREDELEGEEG